MSAQSPTAERILTEFPTILSGVLLTISGLSRISIWGDCCSQCVKRCGPIYINLSVLGDVGFAILMILAFKASEAIKRYDKGASVLTRLHRQLTSLAMIMI